MTTARTPVPAPPAQAEVDTDVFASPLSASEEEILLLRSVSNSRKRFLLPGVLRGDLVADKLEAQEASASPFLKKS